MRESRRAGTAYVILLASLLVITAACVSIEESADGREIYAQICARCHGTSLEGGVGPTLGQGSEAAGRDDVYWTQTISRGRGRMPAFPFDRH